LVFWEMMTQKDLFTNYTDLEIFTEDIAIKGVRPPLDGVDPILAEIIKRCWAKDVKIRPTFKELIPILQNARVDINLPSSLCPVANELWKTKFLTKSKVPADLFLKNVALILNKPESALHKNCLQALLLKKSVSEYKELTTGKVQKLLKWFGPIKQGDSNMLLKMELCMRQPWFFGTLDSEKSEGVLEHQKKNGTFLVRLNNGGGIPITQSPFTISRVENGQSVHTRVYPSAKGEPGYYIKIDGAATKVNGGICQFIAELQNSKKEICGSVAEGHPFQSVFADKPKKQSAYQVNPDMNEDDI